MSSSVHVDNKKKEILILGKGLTQGLGQHSLTSEKMYSIKFTMTRKKFCLSLHYNGANCCLFVNGIEIIKFKAKRLWACSNFIMLRKCLKKLFSRQYEKKLDLMVMFMILVWIILLMIY